MVFISRYADERPNEEGESSSVRPNPHVDRGHDGCRNPYHAPPAQQAASPPGRSRVCRCPRDAISSRGALMSPFQSHRECHEVRFLRGRLDQLISPGVHIGRRHDAPPGRGWEVIFVDVVEERDAAWTFVFRFGQAEPDPLRDWEVRLILTGLETLTREAVDMPAIEDVAATFH